MASISMTFCGIVEAHLHHLVVAPQEDSIWLTFWATGVAVPEDPLVDSTLRTCSEVVALVLEEAFPLDRAVVVVWEVWRIYLGDVEAALEEVEASVVSSAEAAEAVD